MERLQTIASLALANVSDEILSDEAHEAMLNREKGDLTGYDCPECKNRGYFWHICENDRWTETCKCVTIRRMHKRMEQSSMGALLQKYTFDNFAACEPWHEAALQTARAFYKSENGWMYIAGQPGCGKTHLCTALVGKMIIRGDDVQYMRWVEDTQRIKFGSFDSRNHVIENLQTCKVLYIDDFLKTQSGTQPDAKDVRMAFEILNMRYCNGLRTIISTEIFIDELTAIDEALGSRVFERSRGYRVEIGRAAGRNWRLRE